MPEPGFFIKVGDLLPTLERTLENTNFDPVDLTSASSVVFKMTHIHGGSVIGGSAIVTAPTGGSVLYVWKSGDTATAGLYIAEWEVTFATGVMTFPNGGYDLIQITEDVR